MSPAALKITILGGGVYAPRLCAQLATAFPGPLRLVLHGRRPDRLETLARAASARVSHNPHTSVQATIDRSRALEQADAVVLLVRVGGLAAREYDEQFPREFGLVGDEGLGVGGLANGWRTLPFMQRLCEDIRRSCPGAFVANLMAPLGMTTACLVDAGLDAVGVCELPAVTRAALGYGPGDGHYGGLNHLGWFWDFPHNSGIYPLKYQARVFGTAIPEAGRAQTLATLDAHILADLSQHPDAVSHHESERPTPWFELALVPLLAARLTGTVYHGFVNVPNGQRLPGQTSEPRLIPGLPGSQIVEVEATIQGTSQQLRASGPIPPGQWPLLEAVAHAERLGYEAAVTRTPLLLRNAIQTLPFSLTEAQCIALTDRAITPVGVHP